MSGCASSISGCHGSSLCCRLVCRAAEPAGLPCRLDSLSACYGTASCCFVPLYDRRRCQALSASVNGALPCSSCLRCRIVASICRQLTALGSRAPLAELGSSTDFSDQRLNAFGLQATVSLTMLRGCNMVAASTGCEEAVVRAAAAMLPAFTATLRRGTAAQHAGQTEEQPIAPDYARLQVVTLLPIVSSLSDADPSEAQRSERASAPLIQAASAWPPWLVAVLEAVEGGPADGAEEAQGGWALLGSVC